MRKRIEALRYDYYPELERLIGRAISDPNFAEILLRDPTYALQGVGYEGRFSEDESSVVSSVRGARSVAEFAALLYERLHSLPLANARASALREEQPVW